MRLFDVNCFIGTEAITQPGAPRDARELLRVMDRHGIDDALVYHATAAQDSSDLGNRMLMEAIADQPRLHPCWVALPDVRGEAPQIPVAAARLLPRRVGPLRSGAYVPVLRALARRRALALLDFEPGHYSQHLQQIDWDGLDWMLGEYSELPVVLIRVGQGVDRTLFSLMRRRANLLIETSYYSGTGGLERLCGHFGAHRALFGSGMPHYTPGAAITLLSYSGLDEKSRLCVASENVRKLLANFSD